MLKNAVPLTVRVTPQVAKALEDVAQALQLECGLIHCTRTDIARLALYRLARESSKVILTKEARRDLVAELSVMPVYDDLYGMFSGDELQNIKKHTLNFVSQIFKGEGNS